MKKRGENLKKGREDENGGVGLTKKAK